MSGKYRLNKHGTFILDNKTNKPLFNWANDSDKIVELLNNLYEENNNLKRALWEAEMYYIEERNDFSIDIEKDMEYLKKEFEREYWNYEEFEMGYWEK